MSIFDDYGTDKDAETNGVVQNYGDFWIKLARAGGSNRKYSRALEKRSAKYRRVLESGVGKIPEAESARILAEVYADCVVIDWGGEGMVGQDGQPLACTWDNVVMVLQALPDLFRDVKRDAENMELFKQEARESDAKNS